MPKLANKTMNLAGTIYQKGSPIPERVWKGIRPDRQGALIRTKLVLDVDTVDVDGDPCPHCGEGPFSRLAQHISLKHPEVFEDIETEDDTSEEEE